MKRMVIILLSLMIFGCSSMWSWHKGEVPSHIMNRREVPVYLDTQFNVYERLVLEESVSEWGKVFNGQMVFSIKDEGFTGWEGAQRRYEEVMKSGIGWVIIRSVSSDERLKRMEVSENTLAFAEQGGNVMVVIGDRIGTRNLRMVVMHEMGHLLGSGHLKSNSLMNAYYGDKQYDCIDKMSVSEVGSSLGIPLRELNYCITPNME